MKIFSSLYSIHCQLNFIHARSNPHKFAARICCAECIVEDGGVKISRVSSFILMLLKYRLISVRRLSFIYKFIEYYYNLYLSFFLV